MGFLLLLLFLVLCIVWRGQTISHYSLSSVVNLGSLPHWEETLILIKPDGVQRRLIGSIVSRFENKGLTLRGLKMVTPTVELLRQHYLEHEGKPFYSGLVDFMSSGPVLAMVWEGKNAIVTTRKIIGSTDPVEALPGTIRGDYGSDTKRNVCHGSDSLPNAQREIKLWFPEGLEEHESHSNQWIFDGCSKIN